MINISPADPSGSAGLFVFKFSTKLMEVRMRIEKRVLNDALRVLGKVVCQVLLHSAQIVQISLET